MPRFIHVNGPPGIGKSTLAQRAFLAEMYDQLTDVLEQRSDSIVIPSRDGEIRQAYTAMCNALRHG